MTAKVDQLLFMFTCTDEQFADRLAGWMEAMGASGIDRARLLDIVKEERMGIINWWIEQGMIK